MSPLLLLQLSVILLVLFFGSLVARLIKLTGRFQIFWMLVLLALLSTSLIIFFQNLGSNYGNGPTSTVASASIFWTALLINIFGTIFLGFLIHFLVLNMMRLFTTRKIANASATIMAGGLSMTFGVIVTGVYYLDSTSMTSPTFHEILLTTVPDMQVTLKLILIGSLSSLVFGGALFGLGSLFTVRFKDGIFIGLMGVIVPLIASIMVAVCVGQLVVVSPIKDNGYVVFVALLFESFLVGGAIIGMYIAGTVADVMRGINAGLDMLALAILLVLAATLIGANPVYIGIGLRGLMLCLAFALLILLAYLHRDGIPLVYCILTALLVAAYYFLGQTTWSVGIVVTSSNWIILYAAVAIIICAVLFGRWISNFLRRRFAWQEALAALFLGIILSLPLLFYSNI